MNRLALRRWLVAAAALALAASPLFAPPPAWWADRGVLTANTTANDYAAVNLGQVKQIAKLARDEMEARLPGGAGSAINTLVDSWAQPPAGGVTRNDYAAVNLGQLKTLAKLYYDRLGQFGYVGQPLTTGQTYPWTTITTDDNDFAAANIGQVKHLFSFSLVMTDSDNDGLIDGWEILHFGNLGVSATADPDQDGLTSLLEQFFGTDPNSPNTGDADGDGLPDNVEYLLGGNPAQASTNDASDTLRLRVYSPRQ